MASRPPWRRIAATARLITRRLERAEPRPGASKLGLASAQLFLTSDIHASASLCYYLSMTKHGLSLYERVMLRVQQQGDCLVWMGHRDAAGYGQLGITRKGERFRGVRAHRVVWEHHNGPVPDGLFVLHSCDNPPCVLIEHLHLGTHADNMREMTERGRAKGHSLPGASNPKARLTEDDVAEMRRMRAARQTLAQIGARFGIRPDHASRILTGKRWKS